MTRVKYMLLLSCLSCLTSPLLAQRPADSNSMLYYQGRAISRALADSLNRLADTAIATNNKMMAQQYANRAFAVSQLLGYAEGAGISLSHQSAMAKHFNDDFVQSETLARRALVYLNQGSNFAGLYNALYMLWYSLFAQSKFEEAACYAQEMYDCSNILCDSNRIFNAVQCIGATYRQQGDYAKCFEYYILCRRFATAAGNRIWLSSSVFSIGELYMFMDDYPSARDYFAQAFRMDDSAIERYRVAGDWDIWVKMEYAEIFAHLGRFDSAWHYFGLYRPVPDSNVYFRVYLVSTGECYYLQGQYAKALQQFTRGLALHRKVNDRNEIMRVLLDIGKTALALNDRATAIKYSREGLHLALETHARQFIRDGFHILYQVYDRAGKPDSANHYFRCYAAMKDSVAGEQTRGRFAAYEYDRKIQLLDKEKELQAARLDKIAFQKKMLIAGILVLLVMAAGVYRYLGYKRRAEKLRLRNAFKMHQLESLNRQVQFEQQASSLRMQTLRAQMNPHFIFNCLSSINLFILKNETVMASDYLTRFSRLIRMILNHSQKNLVPLEEELEMLRLYLDMERLRFNNSFDYFIETAGQITAESVFIPPLLLQPFAENAVWHGLMHKAGKGQLTITVSLSGAVLRCVIADNGVGRKAAEALRSKSAEKDKPMGMRITRDRLALLNGAQNNTLAFAIEDIFDERGLVAGTRVVLQVKYACTEEPTTPG